MLTGWALGPICPTALFLRMQESQRNMEQGKTLPWFLIEEDNPLTLAIDTNTVALPEGFIREVDWQPMRYIDSTATTPTPRKVMKKTFEDALDAYGARLDGAPLVYVIRKEEFYFFPAADVEYTLYHSYYKAGDILDTNIENVWLEVVPELLIGDAGARMAADLRDDYAKGLFGEIRNAAWDSVFKETIMRGEAARRQAVGSGL